MLYTTLGMGRIVRGGGARPALGAGCDRRGAVCGAVRATEGATGTDVPTGLFAGKGATVPTVPTVVQPESKCSLIDAGSTQFSHTGHATVPAGWAGRRGFAMTAGDATTVGTAAGPTPRAVEGATLASAVAAGRCDAWAWVPRRTSSSHSLLSATSARAPRGEGSRNHPAAVCQLACTAPCARKWPGRACSTAS